jgi:parallel beta-helix repeat protein
MACASAIAQEGGQDVMIGTDLDLQGFLDTELAAGKKRVVVPPGQYRVTPRKREHLRLAGLSAVEIVAEGVEMICTETTRALTIVDCNDLKLKGLTIDYDPLPYTQGRIIKLSQDNTVHDIELFDGYPAAEYVRNSKYEIFRPDTRTLRFGSYHQFSAEVLDAGHIRVTRKGRYMGEKVGDIIAIGTSTAPGGQIPHAVYTSHSAGVVLEGITLYASNCFGFLESDCKATHYLRCKIDRRAPGGDLKQRAQPRIRSLNADAYHSKHATIGPRIEACVAKFMGDDCINICGDYHLVMAANGTRLRVLAKRKLNIRAGDPLEVVAYDGRRLPDAEVISTRKLGETTAEELAFLSKQRMHAPFRQGKLGPTYEIVVDREMALPMGSTIRSANRVGNGFSVVDCDFGFNRSRGILIKASQGEVRDNRMEGCWGEAIKVSPEFWWLEAGSSNDVKIVGNRILNCLGKGIAVYAIPGKGGTAPAGAHNDIVIENNIVTKTAQTSIWVTSTRGLTLRNNTVDDAEGGVVLENCDELVGQETE